jgi:hypothetical protein
MSRATLQGALLAAACALSAGCGSPAPVAATAISALPAEGATIVSKTGLALTYGLKRVQVRLKPPVNQHLPPFVNAQTSVNGETTTISADNFDAEWLSKVSVTSRPDLTGGVAVFLRDAEGRLVGSAVQPTAAVGAEIPLEIVLNKAEASILRSLDNNNIDDGVVIRATPLEMASGYMDGQPGVARVEIEVSGPAYGDGQETAKLGTLKGPAIATYQWQPGVASGTFDPAKLAEPGTPLPFYLTTRAFDAEGREVGVTKVKIAIIGTATVTVGVNEDSE